MKALMVLVVLFSAAISLEAQQTIAFQGFESSAQDNWNFTPPFQNPNLPQVIVGPGNYGAGYSRTGNNSCRLGGGSTTCGTGSANCINGSGSGGSCSNNLNGLEVVFEPVDINNYTDVNISVAYRTHILCGGGGPGFDASDRIFFEVQLDGGPWTTVASIIGSNDCIWNYNTNPVQCGGNNPVANPFVYQVPECTATVAFRVRILINRSDEVLYIDDVTISGTPGGIVFNPILIQHIDP